MELCAARSRLATAVRAAISERSRVCAPARPIGYAQRASRERSYAPLAQRSKRA